MLPKFRYFEDPLKENSFRQGEPHKCQCCEKDTDIWCDYPLDLDNDINCICPECIASGAAAGKFDCGFQEKMVGKVSDPEKIREWMERTPPYWSIQPNLWYTHCDDFCTFVGHVKWEDLVEMGVDKEIEETYDIDVNGFELDRIKECMTRGCYIQGYLFRCLHCGKHLLIADCD